MIRTSPITDAVEAPDEARARAEVAALHAHAAVFVAGMIVIFSVNLMTNLAAGIADHWSAWWSAWALIGWGIGLAIHALVVRLVHAARVNEAGR